jgi:protein-S-isoprenylcysteine O-methyltransferase Ste14
MLSFEAWLILLHQLLFQGMFVAKNLVLRRRLGQPIRGANREANRAIALIAVFITLSLALSLGLLTLGHINLLPTGAARGIAIALLAANLLVSAASLRDLGDSWRVGVIEEQQTALVDTGIYGRSRNPYFLAYLLLLAAYTVLLQNVLLLLLSLLGFYMIHAMILREEEHLARLHGEEYEKYRRTVARYFLV